MLTPLDLPALAPDEAEHSERVAAAIGEAIREAGGWVPFSTFMRLALYAPGLGYYSAGARKFGPAGDFVTAPELTPLFARCLATQVAEVLGRCGGGEVLEVGAGSGALAADLLAALAGRGALPARYRILEVSGELRERQRATLSARVPELAARVEWLDAPPHSAWRGVLVGNEVLDALPVERFRVTREGFEAIGVVAGASGGFAFEPRPADPRLADRLKEIAGSLPAPLPAGFESEACLMLPAWIGSLAAGLSQGVMLFVDYGLPRAQYYHPARDGGTLCGFFRHRRIGDVLARPGLQDITAWVDFTAVAQAAAAAGLGVAGFATQAHFLLATGLERELQQAPAAGAAGGLARSQAVATLMLPGEMGERFKVIALARGVDGPLGGFAFRDLADRL
ncbi:MAG: SAM-dependent methyltransferase [Steroidobacteraceae bacterium]|jgi:SAM-dependent MidA family methyltransferase|nr:SAM-dependent methyltransferase [Steroidobacteraceae bacterium]